MNKFILLIILVISLFLIESFIAINLENETLKSGHESFKNEILGSN